MYATTSEPISWHSFSVKWYDPEFMFEGTYAYRKLRIESQGPIRHDCCIINLKKYFKLETEQFFYQERKI